MNKHFNYKSDKQIFRLLISDSDKLLIETRDTETKEVFFNCFELENGKKVFNDLQLEEKTWLGIEAIYKDIIFFHKFPKPDMPGHKEIIAFDLVKQKTIWQNNELVFSFAFDDKVYSYSQGFEERFFYALDYKTGELVNDLGNNLSLVNSLRTESENSKDWSRYIYPELKKSYASETNQQLIKQFTESFSLVGEIEWAELDDMLLLSFHSKDKDEKFTNRFAAVAKTTGTTILFETLNEKITALLTDSFFVYKKFLFLLKGKNEVFVYKTE